MVVGAAGKIYLFGFWPELEPQIERGHVERRGGVDRRDVVRRLFRISWKWESLDLWPATRVAKGRGSLRRHCGGELSKECQRIKNEIKFLSPVHPHLSVLLYSGGCGSLMKPFGRINWRCLGSQSLWTEKETHTQKNIHGRKRNRRHCCWGTTESGRRKKKWMTTTSRRWIFDVNGNGHNVYLCCI